MSNLALWHIESGSRYMLLKSPTCPVSLSPLFTTVPHRQIKSTVGGAEGLQLVEGKLASTLRIANFKPLQDHTAVLLTGSHILHALTGGRGAATSHGGPLSTGQHPHPHMH